MSLIKYILLLVTSILYIGLNINAQEFGNKEHYLIDSLVLSELSTHDVNLLDSCLNKFHTTNNDSVKLNILTEISDELLHDKWIAYQHYQIELINKYEQTNNANYIKRYRINSLINLGFYYRSVHKTSKALDFYSQALKQAKEQNQKESIALILNNIGVIYSSNKSDYQKTLKLYKEALAIRLEIKDDYGIANSYLNIGTITADIDPIESTKYFFKALKKYQNIKHQNGEANALKNIAILYNLNNNDSALFFIDKAINLFKSIGNKTYYIATLLDKNKISPLDISTLNNALEMSKETKDLKTSALISKLLSDQYKATGNYSKSLVFYKAYIQFRDSTDKLNNNIEVIKKQAEFEYKQQKEIDDLNNQKILELEKEKKEKQLMITYSATFGLIIILLFFFFIYKRLKRNKRQKNTIQEQHKEITDSINYAKRIQKAIIPSKKSLTNLFKNHFTIYIPKEVVSGNFYWLQQKENTTYIAVADCLNRGIAGAMISIVCNDALNSSLKEYNIVDPGEILDRTKDIIKTELKTKNATTKEGMNISLCSIKENVLAYSGANQPLWIVRGAEIIVLNANPQIVGKSDSTASFKTYTHNLKPNDTVYLFTGGHLENFKTKNVEAFKLFLLSIQNKTISEQKELIIQYINKSNQNKLDDICIVGFNVN